MQPLPAEFNPFVLMLDPQSVLSQIEHSERLERLSRRVCRPLDKPLLSGAVAGDEDSETEAGSDADIAADPAFDPAVAVDAETAEPGEPDSDAGECVAAA